MTKTKTIKLTDLLVNPENYRFDPVSSQKEAIDQMIEDQMDDLYNLAEHILTNGLNPNDPILVVNDTHNIKKYIVLEGNRRVTALKLLHAPELIEGAATLKRKFKKLHENNLSKLKNSVDCIVYDTPEEADMWIGLKHGYGTSGTSTSNWESLQKQRFADRTEGKTSTSLQIIKLIQNDEDVPVDIKNKVSKINTSNLDRLVSDPDVRSFLGIEINNGVLQSTVEKKQVIKGLTKVVKDILDPKFTVKKIYTKQDRRDYIANFPKTQTPNTSASAPKPWQFNSADLAPITSKKSTPASKTKVTPKDRSKLIPKTCTLAITNPKVNAIYHELMEIDVNKHPNAVAVLFRVFFELSIDCYLESNNLAGGPSAAKSAGNLQQKANNVASHLENKKHADAAICKGVRASIKDGNSVVSIDTWHAYVHNNRFSPKAGDLIITWDNMQDFMVTLWTNIK